MSTLDASHLTWLQSLDIEVEDVEPLQGDVSPRRYFRLRRRNQDSAILAVYPKQQRDTLRRFLETTRLFEDAAVRVPEVLGSNSPLGLMLLEDLGPISLFDLAAQPWTALHPHIERAIESIRRLAASPPGAFSRINPDLDGARLERELDEAKSVFLQSEEFSGGDFSRRGLYASLDRLLAAIALDPLVASHRDFMSRNLMLPQRPLRPATVIDHQDACLAPRFYDLASLLNDSLFLTEAAENEILTAIGLGAEDVLSYRRCAVQRTLKATATYVKFALRGFERHLHLVAPTLRKTAWQLEQLPEGKIVSSEVLALWRDPEAVARGFVRILPGSGQPPAP